MGGSGGEGVGQAAETESTLALAENVYVNLPCPYITPAMLFVAKNKVFVKTIIIENDE